MPTATLEFIHLGTPRFRTPVLAARAREQGLRSAWQQAWENGNASTIGAALADVEGEFAVAQHDAAGRSLLAVDRFGIRTLCYRVDGGVLRFAERADALANVLADTMADAPADAPAETPADIDPQAIHDYLYFHAIPSPRTVFRGVFRLPPGHFALFEDGRLTVQRYWTPRFTEDRRPSFETLRGEFRELLRNAVARELDGGKAACFLSGGTDSSTVAGMIGLAAGRPAASYSIGFDADGYDEMQYARLAARRFGTEHHELYVTPEDLVRHIPAVAAHCDQPFGNSSALPAYCCAKMAREDGVTKILAGDGGDELFGGNSRYAKQRIFGWYGGLPAALRESVMEPLLERSPLGKLPLLRKGASYVEQARVPMPDRLQIYNLLLRLGRETVLTPAFLAQVDAGSALRHQQASWAAADTPSELNRTLAYDWRYTLAESDLPKVNMTTRLAGLEVGFPMLDSDLLAFSLKLPVALKLRGLKLRWFFKEALRGFLPDEILTKKKQGFGLPFGVWAIRHAGLGRLAADSLGSLSTRGFVRPEFIRNLLDVRLKEHPGYYGEMVWILMMLEQWLQHHAPGYRLAD